MVRGEKGDLRTGSFVDEPDADIFDERVAQQYEAVAPLGNEPSKAR